MEKANLETLLERKQRQAKKEFTEIQIDSLGMSFQVQRLPIGQILSIMDRYKDDDSYSNQFEMFKELVYMSVPLLRNQKLIDAYEVHNPFDVVTCVLEDNIEAITAMANGILQMYGLNNGEAVQSLKNS